MLVKLCYAICFGKRI